MLHPAPLWSSIQAKRLANLEGLFTQSRLDVASHVDGERNLSDPRAQDPHWFERVVLLRSEPQEPFAETFVEGEPARTFAPAGYSDTTMMLLNQLSSIRFVTQKLSQEQQQRRRERGERCVPDCHRSLYPHL